MAEDRGDIVRNSIQTPDGTVLESKHHHDYRNYTDENGEVYMVDGGHTYLRRSMNTIPAKSLDIFTKDDFTVVRQHLLWGSYGINGDQPKRYISLAKMQSGHIEAVLKLNISLERKRLYEFELEMRGINL
ncbi:hypothetical protein GD1_189 [Paraglaciecola Antarctic GD virus 1]|nr:hypothetical protein GD1_189 [Paraglaciecola Antarctic GD virus 1]